MPITESESVESVNGAFFARGVQSWSATAINSNAHVYRARGSQAWTSVANEEHDKFLTASGQQSWISGPSTPSISGTPDTLVTARGQQSWSSSSIDLRTINPPAVGRQSWTDESTQVRVRRDEADSLTFTIDLYTPPTGNYRKFDWPRLRVDGTNVEIVNYDYNEGEGGSGAELSCVLLREIDLGLFGRLSSIDFGLGRRVAGVWEDGTMTWLFKKGIFKGQVSATTGSGGSVGDNVTVQCGSQASDRLAKTAKSDLIIFDPLREDVDLSQEEPLTDTDGRTYPTEVESITGMTLYDVLEDILVGRCGFETYKTNIPNYPIRRADISLGQSLFQGVSGYIGMFDPVVYELENEAWVVDTTSVLPAGFPAPRSVTASHYTQLNANAPRARIDALLVQYVELENAYDYTTIRFENDTKSVGPATVQDSHRIIIEFRKHSQPYVVQRTALNIEETETRVNGIVAEQTTENLTYDSLGTVTERIKTVVSRLPDLSSSTDVILHMLLQDESTETETYSYATHPFKPKQRYCVRKTYHKFGLIAVDSANPDIGGVDFESGFKNAWRNGTLKPGVTLRSGNILSREESSEPMRNGQVRTRVRVTDEIKNLVVQDYTEERPGDVGLGQAGPAQKKVLVFDEDNATRTTDRIEALHIGELPLTIGLPLARRTLKARKEKGAKASIELIGFDRQLKRGATMRVQDRKSNIIGDFIILGRRARGDRNGCVVNYTAKQI